MLIMLMCPRNTILVLAITCVTNMCVAKKIRYISTERPNVTYVNPHYYSYANLSSRRFGRGNPFYYVDFHIATVIPMGAEVTVDFYFFEYLTNVYKRSFVEMHFQMCDLIHKDMFFGPALKQGGLAQPCPYPPGEYHLYNMTININNIPRTFPFRKGRIYCNITHAVTKDLMGSGHIDMEIRESHIKDIKGKKL